MLRQGAAVKSVRVPCTEAFSSLQTGTPLAVHFREVEPLLSWPSFIEVWHATSAGKVLYSYSALAAREAETRWMIYAVAFGTLFVVGPLVLFLCNCAWRETECVHHGESSPPIKR